MAVILPKPPYFVKQRFFKRFQRCRQALVRMRYPRLPGPFLGVGLVVAVEAALGWKVNEVGNIPLSMPPFIGFTWAPAPGASPSPRFARSAHH